MKKILYLVALMATLIPALSFAAPIRVEKELGWKSRRPSRFALPTTEVDYIPRALASLDTAGLGDNGVDTTGVFSLRDIAFPPNYPVGNGVSTTGGFSGNDSLLVGYLYIYRDSTAAGSPTFTGCTATFQTSSDGNSWASAQSYGTISVSSGESSGIIPMFMTPSSGSDWKLISNRVRVVFATVNGILPAARVRLVYWADDGRR